MLRRFAFAWPRARRFGAGASARDGVIIGREFGASYLAESGRHHLQAGAFSHGLGASPPPTESASVALLPENRPDRLPGRLASPIARVPEGGSEAV
jgi:hypothetical protein